MPVTKAFLYACRIKVSAKCNDVYVYNNHPRQFADHRHRLVIVVVCRQKNKTGANYIQHTSRMLNRQQLSIVTLDARGPTNVGPKTAIP